MFKEVVLLPIFGCEEKNCKNLLKSGVDPKFPQRHSNKKIGLPQVAHTLIIILIIDSLI